MGTLGQDLRYGIRMLWKSRGFTAVEVLTLALGIGANTAIFSVVNAVLLRPLPYAEPDRIIRVWATQSRSGQHQLAISAPNFIDLRARNHVFEDMVAYRGWQFIITGTGEPVRVFGQRVSARLFPILGVRPVLGRTFIPEEDVPGNDNVVILSYGLWRTRFGSDPNIIGRSLTINNASRTVVGVMPSDFYFASRENGLWVPIAFAPADLNRGLANLFVIGRLRPGVSLRQAQMEMDAIAGQLERQYTEVNKGKGVRAVALQEDMVGDVRPALLILLGAVGFVLLVACANVANLQLTRATARQKEMAIRTALGATRRRLVRQLLTESISLSLVGGGLALLLAFWGLDLLVELARNRMPRVHEVTIDRTVLGFTLLVSILIGIVFGLMPSLQASKPDLNNALKEAGSAAIAPRRQRVRGVLVVVEVALAIVLLAGAGLMMKSFLRLQQVNPGFNADHLLTFETFLTPARYPKPQQQAAFYQEVLQRIRILPGVQSAGANIGPPFTGAGISFALAIKEHTASKAQLVASYRAVSPGYFQTMGIPLLKGRDFAERDHGQADGVAIINESFTRRYFPNEDPIGKHLDIGDGYNKLREIVGVVGDTKSNSLTARPAPEMYVVYLQRPWQWISYVVRTNVDPVSLAPTIRNAVWSVDKDVPVNEIKTMEQLIGQTVTEPRLYMFLLGVFAAMALALATVGVYGVVSYAVTQRTHEIGIRLALGAQTGDVLKLVVGQGMMLALIGVGIGLAGAFVLTRLMSSLLYEVSATDPATFLVISLLLTGVALLASYVPARKATKVDPMVALRYE